ncbi:MAG: hypothetical protein KUG75_14285 [Pseudomonadales bacterium]|nr:hypothetical protein [Pseudomonadales bacterium]
MIVLLLIAFVALVVGALLGTLIAQDAGYVLIAYNDMSIESSIWFALFSLFIFYLVLRFVMGVGSGFISSRLGLQLWNNDRRAKKSRSRTLSGLLLMEEGQWLDAKNILLSSASRSEFPWINYITAARAAQQTGDFEGRDKLLALARESTPDSEVPALLVKAQLQIDAQQWNAALATLLNLRTLRAANTRELEMFGLCYSQLKDWDAIIDLLPEMRKQKKLDDRARQTQLQLETKAWRNKLIAVQVQLLQPTESSKNNNIDKGKAKTVLHNFWRGVPKNIAGVPEFAHSYANALIEQNLHEEAETLVVKTLNRSWDTQLAKCYGGIRGGSAKKQIAVAESWLKQHSDDPNLLLSLGRISMHQADWQQARVYFESSLKLRKSADTYAELARLCLALDDIEQGREYMMQAVFQVESAPEVLLPGNAI